MRRIKYLIFVFTAAQIFIAKPLFGSHQDFKCELSQCYTTEEAVFLKVNQRWLSAEAVSHTTDGIYVMEEGCWISIQEAIEADTYWVWTCTKCGYPNAQGRLNCRNCGKSR